MLAVKKSVTNLKNAIENSSRENIRDHVYYKEMPDIIVKVDQCLPIQAQILDLSPNGIGIYHSSFEQELIGKNIEIVLGQKKTYSVKGTINTFDLISQRNAIIPRVGVVFENQKRQNIARPKRFQCSKKFPVSAYGDHPYRYNHTLLFKVSDFSFNGMTIMGEIKENMLLPGTVLLLNIMLPTVGEFEVKAEVTNIRSLNTSENEHKQFIIGTVFVDPPVETLEAISRYLILDVEVRASIKDLRDNGFLIPLDVSSSMIYSYVSNSDEWEQVLKLRLRAAQKEGRWVGETDYTKLSDEYDKYSRHIICKVENRIIASARFVFNNGYKDRVEHSKYFNIPEKLWKHGFIEASRLCTDPDYRGSSVFLGFLQHGGRIVGQQNIRYVLMNCEDSLVPIYGRYGAKSLGVSFNTEFMKDKRLNMILCDFEKIYKAKSLGIINWFFAWASIYDFLSEKNFIRYSKFTTIKLLFYKMIGEAFLYFYKQKANVSSINKRNEVINKIRQRSE